jgi:hypothetical protein
MAAPRKTMDAPKSAKGAMESEDAAPSAGGAAAGEDVSLAPSDPDVAAASVALFEYGVADENAPLLAPLVTLIILLLSLVNPLVSLALIKLVLPLSAADVVELIIASLLLEDVSWSWNTAWMRISWHWSPIDSSYRFPNAPLMQRHQRVEPPMASESLPQTAKPPV